MTVLVSGSLCDCVSGSLCDCLLQGHSVTVFVSGSLCDCLFQGHSVTACFMVRKDSSVTSALQFLFEGLEIVVHYCTCFRVRKDFSPLLCLFWGQERLQSIIVFISGQR